MLIIGELINASRKPIENAIKAADHETIQNVARDQFEAGANFIDVNAGVFIKEESEYLKWLVTCVQSAVKAPCSIDSPNPTAIELALSAHDGIAMINSISLEKERIQNLLPIVAGTNLKVVALCMSDEGIPKTAEQRLAIADRLVNTLVKNKVQLSNIYLDPLVQPISVNTSFGREFLDAVELIMKQFDGIHTVCGISNISYGLPERRLLNQIFSTMAISRGLDSIIMNPLDKKMMANITAAEALMGKDDFCTQYLMKYRANKLHFK